MKLYLLFEGSSYYPSGGEDLRRVFDNEEVAIAAARATKRDWSEVVEIDESLRHRMTFKTWSSSGSRRYEEFIDEPSIRASDDVQEMRDLERT